MNNWENLGAVVFLLGAIGLLYLYLLDFLEWIKLKIIKIRAKFINVRNVAEQARAINLPGKVIIISVVSVCVAVIGNEEVFRHCSSGRTRTRGGGYSSGCHTDIELVVISTGIVILLMYYIFFGFRKKL